MSNRTLSKNAYPENIRLVVQYIIPSLINITILIHMIVVAISMTLRNYRKPNWPMGTYLGKYYCNNTNESTNR
jgi:hypothetical protein